MTWKRLKDVAALNRVALPETTDPTFRFRYVDISCVDSDGAIEFPAELTTFAAAPSRARRLAPEGATIVSTVRTYLKAVALVPAADEPLVFSTGFAVIEAGPELVPDYLFYVCRSDWFVNLVMAHSVGVSYPAINASDLGGFRIPVPPLPEQQRIVSRLREDLLEMRDLERQLHVIEQLLTERRTATYFAEVTGQEQPVPKANDGPVWAPSIPAHWRSAKLTSVSRLGSGHTPSRANPDWWQECTIPWITTGEVAQMRSDRIERIFETRENISELGLANSSAELHPAGTVVLCRTAASAGYSAIMGLAMTTSQDFATWTCGPALQAEYLLFCLRAMRPDLLNRLAVGSTHRTIYMPDIEALRVPLPPISEQKVIVEAIRRRTGDIDEARDALNRQLHLLSERRATVLTSVIPEQVVAA